MPDREKVIKGLEHCGQREFSCNGCPYKDEFHRSVEECLWCRIDDVLSLLKEQEAVAPEREHSGGGTTWWNVCGNCKTAINPNDKFCHECGRPVKWE